MKTCAYCGKEFYDWTKEKYCSKECARASLRGVPLSADHRRKLSEGRKASHKCRGENLYNWKGGATNRKLGSDMAQSVTGGGLHGKDLSKADVSVNIYAFLRAQETGTVQQFCCAIGDDTIDGRPYAEIVDIAREYIQTLGGFEKFAEWGLY